MSADQQSSDKHEFTKADLHNIRKLIDEVGDNYGYTPTFLQVIVEKIDSKLNRMEQIMSEQSEQFIQVDFSGTVRIKAKNLLFRNKKKGFINGEQYLALSEDEQEEFDQIDVLDGIIDTANYGEEGESVFLNHASFEIVEACR